EGSHGHPHRIDGGITFKRRRRIAPQHKPADEEANDAGIAVHSHRAHGFADLEPTSDPEVELLDQESADGADDKSLDRMVEVVSGGGGDDAGETTRVGPERISPGHHEGGEQTARQ